MIENQNSLNWKLNDENPLPIRISNTQVKTLNESEFEW